MIKKSLQTKGKKFISIITIFVIVFTLINALLITKTYSQERNIDNNNIYNINESLYPGYAELLQSLKNSHPNWNFTLLYTDLEWNDVLTKETTVDHSRSLIQGKKGEWLCTDPGCVDVPRDGTSWFGASQVAVAYYLDPRNFLTEDRIFQFETLSYIPSIHTEDGIEAILKGTFMSNTRVCDYYKNENYGEKTFAQIIMNAAKASGVSPYHIASRVRIEIGANGSGSSSGKVSGYEGLFNFWNIGATPTSVPDVNPSGDSVINGLIYARSKGWTTPEISITEGAKWIASKYISKGQDSLYLQKWDVDNRYLGICYHQYQQNIQAPTVESCTTYSSYKKIFNNDLTNTSFNFIIPMYKNIPKIISRYPSNSTYVTQNAQINDTIGYGVRIRQTPNGSIIGIQNTGYQFLRIELNVTTAGGSTWDKVMLDDGTIAYVATQFIIENKNVSELSKEGYMNVEADLLNGPRITENGTTAIKHIFMGQPVTILEEGKYTFDGYSWDKVKLQDETIGYIQSDYVTEGIYGEKVKITCDTELALRDAPSGTLIKWIDIGVIVNRIEKGTEKVNGYYWDKVVTGDGITGYMAREKYNPEYLLYLTPVNEIGITTNKFYINTTEGTIKISPEATLDDIKTKYPQATIVHGTEKLETGAKVSIDGKEYTIIKLGDVNGDGLIDIIDLALLKRHLIGVNNLQNEFNKAGILQSGKEEIDIIDLALLKRHLTGSQYISL